MRIKDALVPIAIHSGVNINQVDRQTLESASGSKVLENINENTSEKISSTGVYEQSLGYEIQGFRIAEDTTTWSSVAVARTNVNVNSKRLNNNINNNLTVSRLSLSSSVESLSDYETHELSAASDCSENSEDAIIPGNCRGIINPNYPGFQHLAPTFLSVFADEDQPDNCCLSSRINEQDTENKDEKKNNNENIQVLDSVNRLDGRKGQHKFFYEKPKLNIQAVATFYEDVVSSSEKCLNYVKSIEDSHIETEKNLCDSNENIEEYLPHWDHLPVEFEVAELQSSSTERPQFAEIEKIPVDTEKNTEQEGSEPEDIIIDQMDLISETTQLPPITKIENDSLSLKQEDSETTDPDSVQEEQIPFTKLEEIDLLSSIGRDIGVDLEKYVQPVPDVVAMESVDVRSRSSLPGLVKDTIREEEDTNKLLDEQMESTSVLDCKKKEKMVRNQARRRQQSHGSQRRSDKRRAELSEKVPEGFDVYNIETAMPKIDLDVIESHLRAAREEERRRRNDREEIRRRLAMGPDADDARAERGRKPSLQSRLQSGMNLQICFMNDTPSDTESPGSDKDSSPSMKQQSSHRVLHQQSNAAARPQILNLPSLRLDTNGLDGPLDEADFFARQARLQTEARMALAQAKEMAHMQMEVERQRLTQSPITEMVRSSLEKVGVQLGEDRRRLSRVLLTELNVAQLQVVANDLHARIAVLNEALVEGLLRRDDLHMEQDSMLVDVEDLTRYLGAKQESFNKRHGIKEQSTVGKSRHLAQQQIASIRAKLANRELIKLGKK